MIDSVDNELNLLFWLAATQAHEPDNEGDDATAERFGAQSLLRAMVA